MSEERSFSPHCIPIGDFRLSVMIHFEGEDLLKNVLELSKQPCVFFFPSSDLELKKQAVKWVDGNQAWTLDTTRPFPTSHFVHYKSSWEQKWEVCYPQGGGRGPRWLRLRCDLIKFSQTDFWHKIRKRHWHCFSAERRIETWKREAKVSTHPDI